MRFVFYEAPPFTRLMSEYFDDEAYGALQQILMQQPLRGPVIETNDLTAEQCRILRNAIREELRARRQRQ